MPNETDLLQLLQHPHDFERPFAGPLSMTRLLPSVLFGVRTRGESDVRAQLCIVKARKTDWGQGRGGGAVD